MNMLLINKREFNEFLLEKNLKLRKKKHYALFRFFMYKRLRYLKAVFGKIWYLFSSLFFIAVLGAFVALLYLLLSGQLLKLIVGSENWSLWGSLLREDWKYIFNILLYFIVVGGIFVITILLKNKIMKIWYKIIPSDEAIKQEQKDLEEQREMDKNMRMTDFIDIIPD